MSEFLISQSMMKSFVKYKQGNECGIQFKAKYFDRIEFPSTDAQRLGHYFEYQATGQLPKYGQVPEPDRTKGGELTAKYKLMDAQIANWKLLMEAYRITIFSTGEKIIIDNYEGTLDVRGHSPDYGPVIVDIKTSGLMEDKWSPFGWNIETLAEKEDTLFQAKHYKWLAEKRHKVDHSFFFAVFSTTNELDFKFIHAAPSSNYVMEHHEDQIRSARKLITAEKKKGFKPYPELKRCHDCPLKDTCEYYINVPPVITVYMN